MSTPEVPDETPDAEFDISERPVRSFARTLRRVLLEPTDFFRGVALRGNLTNPLVFALGCFFIGVVLSTIILQLLGPYAAASRVAALSRIFAAEDLAVIIGIRVVGPLLLGLIAALFVGALFLFIVAGLYHLLVMLFVRRSHAGFEATFKASAYASAIFVVPFADSTTVVWSLPYFYGLYLTVVGIRELHSTTSARAAAVVLIPASVARLADLVIVLSEGGVDLLLEEVTPEVKAPAVVADVVVLVAVAILVLLRSKRRS